MALEKTKRFVRRLAKPFETIASTEFNTTKGGRMTIHVTREGVILTHELKGGTHELKEGTHEIFLDAGWPLKRKRYRIGYNTFRSGKPEHSRTEVVWTPGKIKGDLDRLGDLADLTGIMLKEATKNIDLLDADDATKSKILSALKKAHKEFD